jgi:glycosyltransferase involved in cell wall biosynthesis
MTASQSNSKELPLVSIGIPTYNRAVLLTRAIESALNQDYGNIEVIVSDNASHDDTESICRQYSQKDVRFKYTRQTSNRGPVANFTEVLKNASGQFFMWLGDDDWIDLAYVSTCVREFMSDPTMALASGVSQYYRNGKKAHDEKSFSLLEDSWWQRVIAYYGQVTTNGMFYGVMQTKLIRGIGFPTIMGGDWMMLANIVSTGKAKVLPGVSVHRELGGMSSNFQHFAVTAGLSRIQARFPWISVAVNAYLDIMAKGIAFKSRPVLIRFIAGVVVFFVILLRFKIGPLAGQAKLYLRRLLIRNV